MSGPNRIKPGLYLKNPLRVAPTGIQLDLNMTKSVRLRWAVGPPEDGPRFECALDSYKCPGFKSKHTRNGVLQNMAREKHTHKKGNK